uniref:Uncharacterized protein n=1 Tax=Romanomermis culicivorax TaxID=13658 RepID=A0A915L6A2_ROMCU
MSNGQPKSGVYVTLQAGVRPYSISEPVLTDENGNYVLQRTFTDYHKCYGDLPYSLHFGKTECDQYPNQPVKFADLQQEFRSDGNILNVILYHDVAVDADMNCH